MKKIICFILLVCCTTPVFADILRSPEEEAAAKRRIEAAERKCPKDKPLFSGEGCYSCNALETIGSSRYSKCTEVCPNRVARYECGPACILKQAPSPDYIYVQCQGWVKRCTSGLQGEDGKCYKCSDIKFSEYGEGLNISKKDCLSCPNTQYVEGYGCLPACPYGKPVLDLHNKICRSCSDKIFTKRSKCKDDDCDIDAVEVWGCSKCHKKLNNALCLDLEV